jgi:SAM-dependent methyltransferase
MAKSFGYPGDVFEVIRRRYRHSEHELAFLASYGIERGARVLDIGCGTGALLRALAAKGISGVGIDPSESFIVYGRELAKASPHDSALIELKVGVAEELKADAEFDAVLCVFNVLAHLPNRAAVREAVKRSFAALRHGGIAVFEIALFLNFVNNFKEFVQVNHEAENMFVTRQIRHVIEVHRGLWGHEENIFVNRGGGRLEHYFDRYEQLIIIPEELVSMFKEVGFDVKDAWSDYRKNKKIGPNSTYILVARRP